MSTLNTLVRKLEPSDVSALVELRREAIDSDPFAFGASPEDDRGQNLAQRY